MTDIPKNISRTATVLLIVACSFTTGTQAASLSFTTTPVDNNTWEIDYTAGNDTLGVPLEEFVILFEPGLYTNLVATATPLNWDPLTIQPDPFTPDNGFYDALALADGIAPGASLGGFTVQFDFLGSGKPGAQPFQVIDPFTFDILEQGVTSPQTVPLPPALWLFAGGLSGLIGCCSVKKRT